MLPEAHRWIVEAFEPEGNPWLMFDVGQELERAGNLEGAASVYDRAFGVDPTVGPLREARAALLDRLAVTEHGLTFRYVPAGPFLMGSRTGDPDEGPLHPVWLGAYWMAETPISWADYCRLMGWLPPAEGGFPREDIQPGEYNDRHFRQGDDSKIRWNYCEDHPRRDEPDAPEVDTESETYSLRPMVAVGWYDAVDLADRLSTPEFHYALPTEAQWEKAARGGLIGAAYPWGDEPPTAERCDFGRYYTPSVQPMRALPPNGYGLYAMSGGVWEWTADWYDADAYRAAADHDPRGPGEGKEKVLRGGSWADCAEAVTVSFRMSREVGTPQTRYKIRGCPMIGFRLCRTRTA